VAKTIFKFIRPTKSTAFGLGMQLTRTFSLYKRSSFLSIFSETLAFLGRA
jgi:hypothetical protein